MLFKLKNNTVPQKKGGKTHQFYSMLNKNNFQQINNVPKGQQYNAL